MTQWSDPQIITALAVGGMACLISLASVFYSWRQSKRIECNTSWDVYRDCVHCHIESALKEFEDLAQPHTLTASLTKNRLPDHMKGISNALVKLEAACSMADRHELTKQKDWEAFATQRMQRVFALQGRLDNAQITFEEFKRMLTNESKQIITDCRDKMNGQRAAIQDPKQLRKIF